MSDVEVLGVRIVCEGRSLGARAVTAGEGVRSAVDRLVGECVGGEAHVVQPDRGVARWQAVGADGRVWTFYGIGR